MAEDAIGHLPRGDHVESKLDPRRRGGWNVVVSGWFFILAGSKVVPHGETGWQSKIEATVRERRRWGRDARGEQARCTFGQEGSEWGG